jgi:hypothetical protein
MGAQSLAALIISIKSAPNQRQTQKSSTISLSFFYWALGENYCG